MAGAKGRDVIAHHGEKMIEVKIRFWTDGIADGVDRVRPKHAWASGVVRMERNAAHGIRPKKPVPFNTILDLQASIEKALIQHEIRLHPSNKMRKYFSEAGGE
jgi:hypothetical protein